MSDNEELKILSPEELDRIAGGLSKQYYIPYEVTSEDSFTRIAHKNGLTWQELYAFNRDTITDPSKIHVGMELKIPQ